MYLVNIAIQVLLCMPPVWWLQKKYILYNGVVNWISANKYRDIFALYCFDVKQGAVSIRKTVLPGMAIPMLKIRRPNGRLIFNMEIAIRR